jgi:hypothetical protein
MLTLQDLLRTRTAQPPLNKAMYFDGNSNTYIRFTDNLINNLAYQGKFSILAWFNALGSGVVVGYADALPPASPSGYVPLIYVVYPNDVKVGEWNGYNRILSYSYSGMTFIHVANVINYDRASNIMNMYMYVNGSNVGSSSSSGAPWNNIDYTSWSGKTIYNTIGNGYAAGWGLTNPAPFKGYIAQVLIYSRVLPGSEIMHNMSNPNNPIRDKLVLWLDARACDTSKNICYDLSGNNNHGTMYNVQIVSLSNPVRVGGTL